VVKVRRRLSLVQSLARLASRLLLRLLLLPRLLLQRLHQRLLLHSKHISTIKQIRLSVTDSLIFLSWML
jgi:hypothetical protein